MQNVIFLLDLSANTMKETKTGSFVSSLLVSLIAKLMYPYIHTIKKLGILNFHLKVEDLSME